MVVVVHKFRLASLDLKEFAKVGRFLGVFYFSYSEIIPIFINFFPLPKISYQNLESPKHGFQDLGGAVELPCSCKVPYCLVA